MRHRCAGCHSARISVPRLCLWPMSLWSMSLLLLPVYHRAVGLVSGKHEYLSYLHMLWC